MKRTRHKRTPSVRRRALEIIAAHPAGCTEAILELLKVGAISIPRLPASQATEGLAFRRGFSFRALSAEDALGQSWTGRRECPGTTPNQSGLSTGSPHVASSLGRDRGRPWSLGRYRGLSRSRLTSSNPAHPSSFRNCALASSKRGGA